MLVFASHVERLAVGWRSGQAKPCLLSKTKKVARVPAVVAVAGCLLTVLMHACRPELWSPIRVFKSLRVVVFRVVEPWK
jgi:hypothetical protein